MVSQSTINRKRSEAYRKKYGEEYQSCKGCGARAQGSAHTIPQSRCKHLHHPEWIWADWNFWPACHNCNLAAETHGELFHALKNKKELLSVLAKYDPETYQKKI